MEEAVVDGGRVRPLFRAVLLVGVAFLVFYLGYVLVAQVLKPELGLDPGGLCRWDCGWYRSVASEGYRPPDFRHDGWVGNYGFFPAFPLAAQVLVVATGLPFAVAGLLMNWLCLAAFCWIALGAQKELQLKSREDAMFFCLAFVCWPWSLYNHIPYSEMLFNLSALGTFVLWRRGQLIGAAAFGIVLTATRVSGIVLPLVLVVELLVRERHRLPDLLLRPDGRVRALGVMPFGLVAVVLWTFSVVGDPLGYFHIQELGWGQGVRNPFAMFIGALVVGGEARYAVLGFVLASGLLLAGVLSRRIPVPLAAFALLIPALVLASTHNGLARYALSLFPLCLMINAVPGWWRWVALAVMAVLQLGFIYGWLDGWHWLV